MSGKISDDFCLKILFQVRDTHKTINAAQVRSWHFKAYHLPSDSKNSATECWITNEQERSEKNLPPQVMYSIVSNKGLIMASKYLFGTVPCLEKDRSGWMKHISPIQPSLSDRCSQH